MARHFREMICLSAVSFLLLSIGCSATIQQAREPLKSPDIVKTHCDLIGTPRVERVSEHVWVAIGYDLANVILIHTPKGNVVVDPLMSPKRGEAARRDLLANAPQAPIQAVIYTHSHIDHIGGASIWMADNPQIWATDKFTEHFYKQYQVFLPIETIRGRRQFGDHASPEDLPCNGIGRRADIKAAQEGAGIRLPTHTFSGSKALSFRGMDKDDICQIVADSDPHMLGYPFNPRGTDEVAVRLHQVGAFQGLPGLLYLCATPDAQQQEQYC